MTTTAAAPQIRPAYELSTAFSSVVPKLQLAWDSTSLGALKRCPRYYELSIVEGWVPKRISVDLQFGLWMHQAREHYYHAQAAGASHDDALDEAVKFALEATWDRELNRPNTNVTEEKNRFTLVRTVVWYLDQWQNDPLRTVVLDSGKPAVELSFRFDSGLKTARGESFALCGHLDRLVDFQDHFYGSDAKTTKHTLDKSYFDGFTPDNQFSLYTCAMKVVYRKPCQGIILDAMQVAVTFSRFMRGMVSRTEEQLREWYRDLRFWLAQAELYATANYWPMNDKACFRCEYRGICSKSASVREPWLKADFTRRTWDPLQARGDI